MLLEGSVPPPPRAPRPAVASAAAVPWGKPAGADATGKAYCRRCHGENLLEEMPCPRGKAAGYPSRDRSHSIAVTCECESWQREHQLHVVHRSGLRVSGKLMEPHNTDGFDPRALTLRTGRQPMTRTLLGSWLLGSSLLPRSQAPLRLSKDPDSCLSNLPALISIP